MTIAISGLFIVTNQSCYLPTNDHDAAKTVGGWCDNCKIGYWDGLEYRNKCCFAAASRGKYCEAHGAVIFKCDKCPNTLDKPGNC